MTLPLLVQFRTGVQIVVAPLLEDDRPLVRLLRRRAKYGGRKGRRARARMLAMRPRPIPRWVPVGLDTIAVAPSLWEEIKQRVPAAGGA